MSEEAMSRGRSQGPRGSVGACIPQTRSLYQWGREWPELRSGGRTWVSGGARVAPGGGGVTTHSSTGGPKCACVIFILSWMVFVTFAANQSGASLPSRRPRRSARRQQQRRVAARRPRMAAGPPARPARPPVLTREPARGAAAAAKTTVSECEQKGEEEKEEVFTVLKIIIRIERVPGQATRGRGREKKNRQKNRNRNLEWREKKNKK